MNLYTESKISPRGKVNLADIKSILKNTLIFFAPAVLIYLGQLQGAFSNSGVFSLQDLVPSQVTIGSIYGWFLGIVINVFLKFNNGSK